MSYPVLDQEPLEDNTYLASSRVVGTSLDTTLNVAFSVLEYALLDAPGAPVKQALLDAGIGKDVEGSYEDGILQPSFSIVAKHANAGDKERFLRVIQKLWNKSSGMEWTGRPWPPVLTFLSSVFGKPTIPLSPGD